MSTSGYGVYHDLISSLSSNIVFRVFGKRYREVIREWEASILSGGSNTKRFVLYDIVQMSLPHSTY
jgi:hypothetical protein